MFKNYNCIAYFCFPKLIEDLRLEIESAVDDFNIAESDNSEQSLKREEQNITTKSSRGKRSFRSKSRSTHHSPSSNKTTRG